MDPDKKGELEMSFEEAKEVLENDISRQHAQEVVDNVYPWWKTFRIPFIVLSVVVAVLCLAVISLAITLQTIANDRERESKQDECYNLFTNASSEAIAAVRAASSQVDSAGWQALVDFANDQEVSAEEVESVQNLAEQVEIALEVDALRLAQRAQWVADGRPLPCPIDPENPSRR